MLQRTESTKMARLQEPWLSRNSASILALRLHTDHNTIKLLEAEPYLHPLDRYTHLMLANVTSTIITLAAILLIFAPIPLVSYISPHAISLVQMME